MKALIAPAFLLSVVTLAGCSSLAGVGGSTEYACPMPEGATCKSVSQTYRDSYRTPAASATSATSSASSGGEAAYAYSSSEATVSKPKTPMLAAEVGTPSLTGPRLMRILFAPWTDVDDNLMEEHRVFVKIEESRWRLDHVKASLYRTYGPIAPPSAVAVEQPAAQAPAAVAPSAQPQ